MVQTALGELAESDIQGLKETGVEEGETIEYKRELRHSAYALCVREAACHSG